MPVLLPFARTVVAGCQVRIKCYDGYDAVATIVRDTRGRRRYLRRGGDGSSDNAGDEEDEDDDIDQIFHGACTKDVEDDNGDTVTLINPECQE